MFHVSVRFEEIYGVKKGATQGVLRAILKSSQTGLYIVFSVHMQSDSG